MAVTAKDIAKEVGVSPATVSMVFHGKTGVSEETRAKVLAAAQKLGYDRTYGTSFHRAKVIQFILYKRHGKVVANTPFFEQLTKGVADEARLRGYQMAISYFYKTEDPEEQLRSIRSIKCAGIILLATEMHTADMAVFESLDVPLIILDNFFPGMRRDAVVIDNRYGAWNAVRYLVHCGHTRLGYLHSNVDIRNFRERCDGYLSAVRSIQEPDNSSAQRIIRVGTTLEAAAADMAAYLATDPLLPTAFFADNDIIAVGCCRALLNAGYRIPQNVSIVGFDDTAICQFIEPQLTTMSVPKERLGALAVDRLDRLIHGTSSENIRISLVPEIMIRDSVYDFTASEPAPSGK